MEKLVNRIESLFNNKAIVEGKIVKINVPSIDLFRFHGLVDTEDDTEFGIVDIQIKGSGDSVVVILETNEHP